jgi:Rieske Fe-S protein
MNSVIKSIKQLFSFPAQRAKSGVSEVVTSPEQLQPESGAVMMKNGVKVAVYKNADGSLVTLAPQCTHLGCAVVWNKTEKIWDCPCHGSKFSATGKVLKGPAKKDLPKF